MVNGPEFKFKDMFLCSGQSGVKPYFIRPGKPAHNAFIEFFNSKVRDWCDSMVGLEGYVVRGYSQDQERVNNRQ
jgi:hypothetical protein